MAKDDEKVARAARQFVNALEDLGAEGGDHAARVAHLREQLEKAVRSESEQ